MPDYGGKVIYSCADEHGVIDVVDEPTARSMHFGTEARQSTMFLHDHKALALVYTHCMMTCLLFDPQPHSVLILGLGGGSLAKFLLHRFPSCNIDVVEMRQKVIELARTHFYLSEAPRLQIYNMDAAAFLHSDAPGFYDLVLVDIHDRDGMANAVGERSFFMACRQRLSARGILAVNLWSGAREEELRKVMNNLWYSFAQQVLRLPVAGKRNCIALAFKDALPQGQRKLLRRRAAELEADLHIEFPDLLRELERANPRVLKSRYI